MTSDDTNRPPRPEASEERADRAATSLEKHIRQFARRIAGATEEEHPWEPILPFHTMPRKDG